MKRKRWILALSLAAAGAGIFAWATRKTSVLRLAKRDAEVVVTRNVVYRAGSTNPKHRLDVYAPRNAKGAPVVHFVHGGYWVAGDKDYYRALTGLYGSVGEALAARGIVTVVQSYRLVPEGTIDDLLDDVITGLRWTEEHVAEHGGDPSRLFMMGHSAGGHVVALIGADDTELTKRGMNPDSVRGYIPISAIWDIADMNANLGGPLNEKVSYPVFGRDRTRWAAYSPYARLSARSRPFLIAIGEHDYPYLIPQAERARARLVGLGVSPAWHLAAGNEHDSMVLRFGAKDDNMTAAVVDFVMANRRL
ncbi:N/A [soil metagenome]